ncbi:DUF3558 domain-containing protein [Amycolatopsis halotolerans]|uniref:DUF3558 domain-containing protein n=1 Tax=Amycolatopsis halotolerans TaxID=330083 RepID=UPI0035E69A3E
MRAILQEPGREIPRHAQEIHIRRGLALVRDPQHRGKSVRRVFALTAAALCALAGCSSTTAGRAAPSGHSDRPVSQTPKSTATDPVPGPGVPKVAIPLDATKFKQNPCDALTARQVSDLLGTSSHVKPEPHGAGGPGCGWFAQAQVVIVFPDINELGLTSFYRAKDKVYPFFLPLAPVDGYPVVAYGEEDHRASLGECDIAMGISDSETIVVSVTQSPSHKGEKDPCDSARGVAETVLANLRGGH